MKMALIQHCTAGKGHRNHWVVIALSISTLLASTVARSEPTTCAALRAAYASAIADARICTQDPASTCSTVRPAALADVCGCKVKVNADRTQKIDQLQIEFAAHGCQAERPICNRMCTAPVETCNGVSTSASSVCGQIH